MATPGRERSGDAHRVVGHLADGDVTGGSREPGLLPGDGRPGVQGPSGEAPLIDLLSEIRGLRGLRHRGQISAVEYERRRRQVLNRI